MFKQSRAYLKSARFHLRDVFYISLIITSLYYVTDRVQQFYRDRAPASDYFIVNQIGIPNHTEGTNPIITYDRTVVQPFSGEWTAEIQHAGTLQAVCASTKTTIYDPEKELPEGGPTLSWLMFREPLPDCSPPPGDYRVHICWTIDRLDAVDVRMCAHSNVFTVRSKRIP